MKDHAFKILSTCPPGLFTRKSLYVIDMARSLFAWDGRIASLEHIFKFHISSSMRASKCTIKMQLCVLASAALRVGIKDAKPKGRHEGTFLEQRLSLHLANYGLIDAME